MVRIASCLSLAAMLAGLAACQPPAGGEAAARTMVTHAANGPSEPLASPDAEGAAWSAAGDQDAITYGQPDAPPLLELACEHGGAQPVIRITRFAPADRGAGAMLALIGKGRARIPVDAVRVGENWVWQARIAAQDRAIDVLGTARETTATIPGAGEVLINAGSAPAAFIHRCRGAIA